MKRAWVWIVVGHLAAIVFLIAVGLWFGELIKDGQEKYAGVAATLAFGFAVWSWAIRLLYNKSQGFFLLVNRARLWLTRTHTYWKGNFDFEVPLARTSPPDELLADVVEGMLSGEHGRAVVSSRTPTTVSVVIDDVLPLTARVGEGRINVHFDRRVLVPSHLYDQYRQRLSRLLEDLQRRVGSAETRYCLSISFADGVVNPYYGFFVRNIPHGLLEDFSVAFRAFSRSNCRVEAHPDSVNVESGSQVDFAHTLSMVLSLQALTTEPPR